MGIPYTSTFIYHYEAPAEFHLKKVNLENKSIIIDANSFMYCIYNKTVEEDREKISHLQLTKTPFGYDGYCSLLHKIFVSLKNKCKEVLVVFDGVYQRNKNKRPDPYRTNTMRFAELNHDGNQLPSLFRHEFERILRDLYIDMIVARGEADPMIAELAKERQAYVVAADSDYHLYDLPQGYVPLRFLNLKSLNGPLYQMADVFRGMDVHGVALWASLIGYDFVSWNDLQNLLANFPANDAQEFNEWLDDTQPDEEKRRWMKNQFNLLRFIQRVGSETAYGRMIQRIPQDKQDQFNKLRSSYINIYPAQSIKTQRQKDLPSYLDRLFVSGNLDRSIINIFINRQILTAQKSDNLVFFNLLLHIIQIAIKWNCQDTTIDNDSCIVIYNKQQYEPLSMGDVNLLPSLDDIEKMSSEDRKRSLLSCVQFALQSSEIMNQDVIHDDHLAWMCLLKLWYHKQEKPTSSKDSVLRAMIVSYLMKKLLNQGDQPDRRRPSERPIPSATLSLKHSEKKLKRKFSLKDCSSITQAIRGNALSIYGHDEINADLLEVERFYNVFCMANQFFHLPLTMPKPSECISELTCDLAKTFATWTNPDVKIAKRLFGKNKILSDLMGEILTVVKQVPAPINVN